MWKPLSLSIVLLATLGAACVPKTTSVPLKGRGLAQCKRSEGTVGEVRGVATVAGQPSPDVEVTLFNGLSPVSARTETDGSYCLPLNDVAGLTLLAVFAAAKGMEPMAERSKADVTGERLAAINVRPLDLTTPASPDLASVIGVTYIRSTAGRPRPRIGIDSFDPNVGIRFDGASGASLRTDASGLLLGSVAPGSYKLVTERNVVVDGVRTEAGNTTILPIFSGEVINF